GRISPRLVSLLSLIARKHTISIYALASDHNPGTNHEAEVCRHRVAGQRVRSTAPTAVSAWPRAGDSSRRTPT
ncbi:MAG: hypothetical protein LC777_04350, partial [Actinobacteria bacterium]|nr:hypothetical protein [Actinomycetota bacterium]